MAETGPLSFPATLAPTSLPIVREFETLRRGDVVFIESTYGDRNHRPYSETVTEFEELVKQAVEAWGRILVPTFAGGRAQQMLYLLAIMFHRELVTPFHVYLDSPMAMEASKAMVKPPELFDEELLERKSRGLLPLDKAWFHSSVTSQDSQALNNVEGPCLIFHSRTRACFLEPMRRVCVRRSRFHCQAASQCERRGR